jgi:hypothetical protein
MQSFKNLLKAKQIVHSFQILNASPVRNRSGQKSLLETESRTGEAIYNLKSILKKNYLEIRNPLALMETASFCVSSRLFGRDETQKI